MASKVYAVVVSSFPMGDRFIGGQFYGVFADIIPAIACRESLLEAGFPGDVKVAGLGDNGVMTVVNFNAKGNLAGELPSPGQLLPEQWKQLREWRACLLGGMRHACGSDEAQADQDANTVTRESDEDVDLGAALAGSTADGTKTKRGRKPGGDAA